MFKWCFSIIVFTFFCQGFAQDISYTKNVLSKLTSEKYHGRGYVKNGCNKAGVFLEKEFKAIGLEPFNNNYRQVFSFPVNTFPKRVKLIVDKKELVVGRDFILAANSAPMHESADLKSDKVLKEFASDDGKYRLRLEKKLTFSVSQEQSKHTDFIALLDSNQTWQKSNRIHIEGLVDTKWHENYQVFNLIGKVSGTKNTDTTIIVSAHYDHLGRLGKTVYFPGANDNASGVSLLLNLAKTIKDSPIQYNVVFILFAGEEIGLVGSKYFTENPLLPLDKIKFLINIDMTGTGEEGITVVNATVFPERFNLLKSINETQKLMPQLKERGKASNSDHYWFTEKGVPAFFIYTMGGIKAYHDIYDKAETLPLTKYRELHQLLLSFIKKL
jgi:aminopeptidase YwaD